MRRRFLRFHFAAHALPHGGNIVTPPRLHDYHVAVTWLPGRGYHADQQGFEVFYYITTKVTKKLAKNLEVDNFFVNFALS